VEGKEKLVNLKLNGLHKHLGERKVLIVHPRVAVGEYYQSFESQHQKNKRMYVI